MTFAESPAAASRSMALATEAVSWLGPACHLEQSRDSRGCQLSRRRPRDGCRDKGPGIVVAAEVQGSRAQPIELNLLAGGWQPSVIESSIQRIDILDGIYRARMSRCADDRAAEVSEAQRQDELALVHEAFAEEHQAAAEELSGELADAHRGAAEKHEEAARVDRAQAQYAREESDAEHDELDS